MLTSTDIRIASAENARFKFALLSQGWVGNGPGATYLMKQIAYADVMRILLTDEPFDAKEALRMNLINEVVPHDSLMARRGGDCEPHRRTAATRRAHDEGTLMNTLLTQLSADGDEGRQAFLEKRAPDFTGSIRQKGEPYPEIDEQQRARLDEVRRELLG
ncbi:1,4-dihydroxy-2-naphthoyl-CoA synthase [Geodia barretti]|uniref:1,4-dihydroxy-2-naphthoyl-CoA synthase n=1 Tax=Geodia barretti TaxID=519541 RepID=A0AA35QSV8_GEOBA|nr:1,4-dihydroxy-2-naphthoyl-CoA synthase [Geodia barretti]